MYLRQISYRKTYRTCATRTTACQARKGSTCRCSLWQFDRCNHRSISCPYGTIYRLLCRIWRQYQYKLWLYRRRGHSTGMLRIQLNVSVLYAHYNRWWHGLCCWKLCFLQCVYAIDDLIHTGTNVV